MARVITAGGLRENTISFRWDSVSFDPRPHCMVSLVVYNTTIHLLLSYLFLGCVLRSNTKRAAAAYAPAPLTFSRGISSP